jgi:hypothetical protein
MLRKATLVFIVLAGLLGGVVGRAGGTPPSGYPLRRPADRWSTGH